MQKPLKTGQKQQIQKETVKTKMIMKKLSQKLFIMLIIFQYINLSLLAQSSNKEIETNKIYSIKMVDAKDISATRKNLGSDIPRKINRVENDLNSNANKILSSCNDADTVTYTSDKLWGVEGYPSNWVDSIKLLTLNNQSNEFGQWFPNPSGMNIVGFRFIAASVNNVQTTVICKIYNSGTDSLPLGPALQTTTVSVDGTFDYHNAIFNVPFTLNANANYVITVQYNGDDVYIGCGDHTTSPRPTGLGEWLSCIKFNNIVWNRSYNTNINGILFDADFVFDPIIAYSLPSSFSINPQCLPKIAPFQINLVNTSDDLFNSRFYNFYKFRVWSQSVLFPTSPLPTDSTYKWNFGDATPDQYSYNPSHTYTIDTNYVVMLTAQLRRWYPFINCESTVTDTVRFHPLDAIISSDQTICEGDSVNLSVSLGGVAGVSRYLEHKVGNNTTIWPNVFGGSISNMYVYPTVTSSYSFKATNGICGNKWLNGDSTITITVNPKLQDAVLSADQTICQGDSVVLSIQLGGTSLINRTISVFDGSNINNWPSTTGFSVASQIAIPNSTTTYSFSANGGLCGNKWLNGDSIVTITVNPKPNPSIIGTDTLYVVGVSGPATYQWQYGGLDIPGATNTSYVPSIDGMYTVVVTQNGCSGTSGNISVSTDDFYTADNEIKLYPNPSNGLLNIECNALIQEVEIISAIGVKIKEIVREPKKSIMVNLQELPAGMYIVRINTSNKTVERKLIIAQRQ